VADLWGLAPPEECRVYVMTSWPRFLFHAAPGPWRIYLALTLPLRYGRIQKLWQLSGGWAQRYGQRQTIGIKPPRLLAGVGSDLRERIFVRREIDDWVRHNTCHELVHACSDHLGLPSWLHEGLAMVTVDRFAGKPTVRAETIAALVQPPSKRDHRNGYPENLVYLAVRGYWLSRYLDETQPALLKKLLSAPQPQQAIEASLAGELGLSPEEFDEQIDKLVAAHFKEKKNGQPADQP
jgi:hypothetical protein